MRLRFISIVAQIHETSRKVLHKNKTVLYAEDLKSSDERQLQLLSKTVVTL